MKKKTFSKLLVLSVIPYFALFIIPVFPTLNVISHYSFFSTYPVYLLCVLFAIGLIVPVIPLSFSFHAGLVINSILKKFNFPPKYAKILSIISAAIIFVLQIIFLLTLFSQMDSI